MNNKGVSAVIGVILMVAITVAIAGTVYVYVANIYDYGDAPEDDISGMVIDKYRFYTEVFILVIQNDSLDIIKEVYTDLDTFYSYDIGNYYDCNNIRKN